MPMRYTRMRVRSRQIPDSRKRTSTWRACTSGAVIATQRSGISTDIALLSARNRSRGVLLLFALVLGCTERNRGASDNDGPPQNGGTAVIGGYVDIRTMNPIATITDLNKAIERYALYMPLVMLDSTLTPQPWLAQSWDTTAVGADSLELSFQLRRDVMWQD